jgi:Amt family ammonium transporter
VLGALLIGFFGTVDTNSVGLDGVFYGGGGTLLWKQFFAVICVVPYSFLASLIIAFVINFVFKMRMSDEEEIEGMDTVLHGESAYEYVSLGSGVSSVGTASSTHEEANA